MKINLNDIDRENFIVAERYLPVTGEKVFVIFPQHIGCRWDRQNLIFRSSVWNEQGEPVSLSFKKFFNWEEQPDLDYKPFSFKANGGCELIEKMDGSTLIVSKYKGELIVRTRGTIDATMLDNGIEIEILKEMYPKAFDNAELDEGFSLLFEWVSKDNQIVINYGVDCDMYLIGMIDHSDYNLASQDALDALAKAYGFKRPQRFDFTNIKEMLDAVEKLVGQEGLCVYCNRGQSIRKVKGAWYLSLHKFKNNATLENVVDLYIEHGYPSYIEFETRLSEQFDHECWKMVRGHASRVCDAYKEVKKIVNHMKVFVEPFKMKPRRDAAEAIHGAYGKTNRAGFCFSMLDEKPFGKKEYRKLLHQVMQ